MDQISPVCNKSIWVHILLLMVAFTYKHFSDQLKKDLLMDSVHLLLCHLKIQWLIVYPTVCLCVCVCLLKNVPIQTKAIWMFKASVNIKRIIFKVSLLIWSGSVLEAPPPVKPLKLHLQKDVL